MLLIDEEKKNLINSLRAKGIKDERLLEAIYRVPREKFIPASLRKYAYDDNALPIDAMQTISQPFTVAYMTLALNVQQNEKVLEIGTGSGYQAAVLCELGAEVFTVERIEKLYHSAKNLLEKLGYKVHINHDDGTTGWEEFSPFDKIIVTAGAPQVPQSLIEQLKIDGRMVIPVGNKMGQKMYVITRTNEGVDYKIFDGFKFVPLIGKEGWSF